VPSIFFSLSSLLKNMPDPERNVQLSYLAITEWMRKKRLKTREVFCLLNVEDGTELEYESFHASLSTSEFDGFTSALSEAELNSFVESFYPSHDSVVTESSFSGALRMMRSIHFPHGSFAEWSGSELLRSRAAHRAAMKKLQEESGRISELQGLCDDLRVKEQELEETKRSLANARANLAKIVSEKMDLSREKTAITQIRHEITDNKAELEVQLSNTLVSLAASEEGLRVTRGQLSETVENLHRLQESNTSLRLRALEDADTVAKTQAQLSQAQHSLSESDAEIERLHVAGAKANRTQVGLVRANHILELKLLKMEEARNEAVNELYQQVWKWCFWWTVLLFFLWCVCVCVCVCVTQ
jgi:DNA repair exonuclease SbcCD ATPase subunit